MRRALDTLSELDGIETTADLTTETFARWVASRAGANPNSTISLLRALRAATRYALEEGWIDRPPSFRRLWPRKAPTRRRPLSHAEVSSLLAHLDRRRNRSWHDRRLHAVASLVAYTGLRASEALFMQVADLDFERRLVWVEPRRRLKTEAAGAPVPMASDLVPTLEAWALEAGPVWLFPGARRSTAWSGGPIGYRPLDRLKAAGAEIGIEGVTFQSLRHTLATLLVSRWGRSAEQASWILRHTSPRTTTEHYIHHDELDTLSAVMKGVSFSA
jgi:integrase